MIRPGVLTLFLGFVITILYMNKREKQKTLQTLHKTLHFAQNHSDI